MHLNGYLLLFLLTISLGCNDKSKNYVPNKVKSVKKTEIEKPKSKKEFLLNEKNAIPFFYEFEKNNKENLVRIITDYGNIDIRLFDNTPYHRANFIYLTKKNYFEDVYFHRIVQGFIIQGGNSDNIKTSQKRRKIGRYLLPPDTRKGHRHHRGIVSMPSSEIDNPHKLASPYEFFIVQKKDGAYHLDGNYTAFGKVVKGMNVVDIISNLKTDKRDWPIDNVRFKIVILD